MIGKSFEKDDVNVRVMKSLDDAMYWYAENTDGEGELISFYQYPYDGNYLEAYREEIIECPLCGGTGEVSGKDLFRKVGLCPFLEEVMDIEEFKDTSFVCPFCSGEGKTVKEV